MQVQIHVQINKCVCTTAGYPTMRHIKSAMTGGHHCEVDTKQQ